LSCEKSFLGEKTAFYRRRFRLKCFFLADCEVSSPARGDWLESSEKQRGVLGLQKKDEIIGKFNDVTLI
jgi:hypothetical protein